MDSLNISKGTGTGVGTGIGIAADTQRASRDGPIGDLLSQARDLQPEQVQRILDHQREHGVRFGEAAVALGLAGAADVARALSQQFRYATARPGSADAAALSPELVVAHAPFSPQAEAFRGIRAQLKLRLRERPGPPTVAVVSAERGDGRSYVAANLAVAFSQLGGRTLLIDADLRHPRQHALFGIATGASAAGGLAHMLSGRDDALGVEAVASLPSLFVLPVGAVPPNPLELLEGAVLRRLLDDVRGKFDHVIVDTPSAIQGMDGAVTAAACGAALLVLRPDTSRLVPAQDLRAAVTAGGALTVGAVFNRPGAGRR